MFPRAVALCFALCLFAASAAAQNATRQRQIGGSVQPTTTTQTGGTSKLENDVFVVSTAPETEAEPEESAPALPVAPLKLGQVERLMLAAIDARIGTPYRMGTEGPYRYDCSGFVWSVFQSAGINFERTSARSFWSQFAPVDGQEKYKFGTLVFFNNLQHVGIVADENGFYHASSSKGVVYSTFNEYWSKRITGFRRVPLSHGLPMVASAGR
jgi:peptidoglycan endopeptidase LytE